MIIIAPVKTEKALEKIERYNTMTFVVDIKAKKEEIQKEVEGLFKVKVDSVRTLINAAGKKYAFVKLAEGSKADEIVEKLKMVA